MRTYCIFLLFLITTLLPAYAQQTDDIGIYEGEYNRMGERHGKGIYTWADGSIYNGYWRYDTMHGEGKLTYKRGDQYDGHWYEGLPHGVGTYIWANGDKFYGNFYKGKKHGEGKLHFANGDVHEGTWKNDKANGPGTHVWANGNKYFGKWKDDQRHGQGVMMFANGDIEQGTFKEDEYVNCQCDTDSQTPVEAYEAADAVFTGAVLSVNSSDYEYDLVEFQVNEFWKGKVFPGKRMFIRADYTSCDFIFFENQTYLIYANEASDGAYKASKCSRTTLLTNEKFDLTVLKQDIECKGDPLGSGTFYAQEDFVCGCDGKTYKNPFQANKSGIRYWTAGACDDD